MGYAGNVEAVKKVGELIAKKCIEKGIKGGLRPGISLSRQVKALAEAARKGGLF
jgi:large subunit ribosomal protein L18